MKLKDKYHKLNSTTRLSNLEVPIIGLTGGIATGKSTASDYLKKKGHPLLCADILVKKIYQEEETLKFIEGHFPQVVLEGKIDFKKLRDLFFHEALVQKKIEGFLYPRLSQKVKEEFKLLGSPSYLFYDVPLLFEKEMAAHADVLLVVYAKASIQKERLILRDKITEELAEQILSKQWPIEQKKKLADFVIKNEGAPEELPVEIDKVLNQLFD